MPDWPDHDFENNREFFFNEVLTGEEFEESRYVQLLELIQNGGLTPAEAIDYVVCEMDDWPQTAWADSRGVDQSTVSENVGKARAKLDDDA